MALSLASGTSSLRFDNIGLTVNASSGGGKGGGGGGGKGSGSGSLSDQRLFSLFRGGSTPSTSSAS